MIDFATLWKNHPMIKWPNEDKPCRKPNGEPAYPNQCAIRMSACLIDSGINLRDFRGRRCGYSDHAGRHALVAEELASWLNRPTTTFLDYAEKSRGVTFHDYLGHTGIVLLRNFYGPHNDGDHIDLWDGSRLALGDTSYFRRSQEVWFWELQ